MKFVLLHERCIALSASFLWWKRVYIGTKYFNLSIPHRKAVMAHELAHLDGHHTELRILCLLLFFPLYGWVCRKLEFRADQAARKAGFTAELLDILKSEFPGSWLYPSNADRRARLLAWTPLKSNRLTGVTGEGTYP
jgi:Zn-dependent protease with chaperone function